MSSQFPSPLPAGAFAPSFNAAPAGNALMVPSVGGFLSMESQTSIDARRKAAELTNATPLVQGLAAHVRTAWSQNKTAKMQGIEERMLQAVRQRQGEYNPEILTQIKQQGGSEIFMMLTSNKCRAAMSWIRDVMLGQKNDKPWSVSPTPEADLPPQVQQGVQRKAQAEAQEFTQATGLPVDPDIVQREAEVAYDRVKADAKKQANERMARMEVKMEDQLAEGNFHDALQEFIDDLVTFPAAILKGPVVKKKKQLKWEGGKPIAADQLVLEWERVDPFMVYPAPHSADPDDGNFIERHRLKRSTLYALRGVEGYNNDAIDAVLDQYGKGGLTDWLSIDTAKATAEGKSAAAVGGNPGELIDALQFWGEVQGKMLIEWGMDKAVVPDPLKDYPCEVWMIGRWCIKAMVNPDPLGRTPYYKACYEEIPGAFWGNAIPDLCRDAQSQCNTAARAIANNMGIASGPQVAYNIDRLPSGENLTQMYPWKIHQYTSDPYGSSAQPVTFFVPPLIAQELILIYRFFSEMADEHTGVPRYMTGDAQGQGGALRTSSGMSMLMQNAGKAIKQVIANIDLAVIEPLVTRLWFYNMVYGTDEALKGDIQVVARGAESLVIKETRQQRINEFLQLALSNPLVGQIVGEEAIAAMLRVAAQNLDMDVDQIVPAPEVIRKRVADAAAAAAATKKQEQDFAVAMATAPSQEVVLDKGPNGEVLGMKIVNKQEHVLQQDPGMPPQEPGMPGDDGSNQPQSLATPTGNVTNFAPRRAP